MERDYAGIALQYAKWAARKRNRKVCKWVRLAAQRQLVDLKRKNWKYEFSSWHAADVCGFIEMLPHVEGEWDTQDVVLEDWQVFILSVVVTA